jgi:hypothetical protein
MTVHANSLLAYRDVPVTARQLTVAKAYEQGEATDLTIEQRTGLPINCVSGRVGELLQNTEDKEGKLTVPSILVWVRNEIVTAPDGKKRPHRVCRLRNYNKGLFG